MLTLTNLSKHYGDHTLFERASFSVNRRERIGLVGRNGHGKSTLFRILIGEETADEGQITVPDGYQIGYLSQQLNFTESTVLREGCRGLSEQDRFEQWKVEKILHGLGFEPSDWARHPSEFSGGFQLRINLTKALVSEPDLLLLDEPTNFLDILSIRWMIRFLRQWPGELIVISHDRHFLDEIATHIVGIHRQQVKKVPGQTADYYEQIAIQETYEEQVRAKQERERQKTVAFVNRFRAQASKARQVQSRLKALDRMSEQAHLSMIEGLDFSFQSLELPAKLMLRANSLSYGYEPGKPLFEDLNLQIGRRDRLCVIGPNGRGKSTLLKLLAGELEPQEGRIKTHPSLVRGYFEQGHTVELHPDHTVEQAMFSALQKPSQQEARRLCGLMMFSGARALKPIRVLSGGERARVVLGRLLATPSHLLLLDEPTHHLDIPSSEALADALDDFAGSAVIVTHDEQLLHHVANRLLVFRPEGVRLFEGDYATFLREVGWQDESPGTEAKPAPPTPKAHQANRAELKALNKRLRQLEKSIERLESRHVELSHELTAASMQQDIARIQTLATELEQTRTQIDFEYLELTEVSEQVENLSQS